MVILDKIKNPQMREQIEKAFTKYMGNAPIYGNVFYVQATDGSSTASGKNINSPLNSLDNAINKCTANNGDIIFLLPGHAETYTTTGAKAVLDVDGVSIIGVGEGSDRPTISFGHTGTTLTFSADNCVVANVLFLTAVDQVVTFSTISGDDFKLIDCESRDITDKEVVTDFTISGDRFTAIGHFKNGFVTGNANDCVFSLNGVENALISNCRFLTKVLTGVIEMVTAASSGIVIKDSVFYVNGTLLTKNGIDTITGSTWAMINCFDISTGSGFSGGSGAALAGDDISGLDTKIGTLSNTGGTASIGGILGDVYNINLATRLIDACKVTTIADGTTITNNTQSVELGTATNGNVLIEEIGWNRAATNFTGPTNLEFSTDNVAGLTGEDSPVGVALLAKFNANTSNVLSLDGTTKQVPFILESGKKLFIHGDDAAVGAGGSTTFFIKYKRLASNAYLA